MEASTDFLPGLGFSNCSRQALEKALLDGMGSCLFERLPSLAPMSSLCGNMFVDPGEQCDCGFPDVSPSPQSLAHSHLCPCPGYSVLSFLCGFLALRGRLSFTPWL